jgi:regulator of replication initiation timing
LKGLFEEHYFDVPEERVDVVQDLSDKVSELESQYETSIAENMDLKKELETFQKDLVLVQVSEELTAAEKDKLSTLASGITYENLEEFENKLKVVKENYFPSTPQETVEYDDEIEVEESAPVQDPSVARYLDAISRTVKK